MAEFVCNLWSKAHRELQQRYFAFAQDELEFGQYSKKATGATKGSRCYSEIKKIA